MKLLFLVIGFTLCKIIVGDYSLQILLENFDNTAGGGRLYNSAYRCDPFWFSGLDQCDIALKICIEASPTVPGGFASCSLGWIDLGEVSKNKNNVSFSPETRYGGWSNPMQFTFGNFVQNFTVKLLAEDVDEGGRQLIDQLTCNVAIPGNSQNGITACTNLRPNGKTTLLKLSYAQSKIEPQHCSSQGGWRADACCKLTCPRNFPDPLPVLLISLDGFRADYLKRNKTMAIQRLIDCGIHTDFMYSSYPTKTFPNHYTIATGLYPESHGIIDNQMYDPKITPDSDRYFSLGSPSSFNPQWWHGEPFWNTVMKNGMIAGTYFWPGTEVKIQNMRPNYWFHYNGSVPYLSRVDTIIQWLLFPPSKRPNFLTLYFDEPDHHGHEYGPQSPQVTAELGVMDGVIDYLMTQLHENNLFHCVNVIIISDHGMKTIWPGVHLNLDNYFNTSGMIAFSAPVGRVMLENSSLTTDQVVSSLRCKNSSFRVYARKDVPKRFHYSKSHRIGDLIVDTDPGLVVSKTSYDIIGTHGWDFRVNSMHALFVAHGPNFKMNYTKESFENIEIYNLMAELLHIKNKAPNNGTNGILHDTLLTEPPITENPKSFAKICGGYNASGLSGCGSCNQNNTPTFVSGPVASLPAQSTSNKETLCSLFTNVSTTIYSSDLGISLPVISAAIVNNSSILSVPSSSCDFVFQNWTECGQLSAKEQILASQNVSLYPLLSFVGPGHIISNLIYLKAPMYNSFYAGVWTSLQIKVLTWATQFRDLVVYSGPIFDYDSDGVQDSVLQIQQNTKNGSWPVPTNYFMILVRCNQGYKQSLNNIPACPHIHGLQVLSVVLPHEPQLINCQTTTSYLFMHTAKVRDIELLTGLEFFADRNLYTLNDSLRLRLHINQQMW